jgi:hypothetical protein
VSLSLDEAMQDAHREHHPYDVEVVCKCGEAWMVRFLAGEPVELDALDCRCGGTGAAQ